MILQDLLLASDGPVYAHPTGRTDHRLAPIHHGVFIFARTRVHTRDTRQRTRIRTCTRLCVCVCICIARIFNVRARTANSHRVATSGCKFSLFLSLFLSFLIVYSICIGRVAVRSYVPSVEVRSRLSGLCALSRLGLPPTQRAT